MTRAHLGVAIGIGSLRNVGGATHLHSSGTCLMSGHTGGGDSSVPARPEVATAKGPLAQVLNSLQLTIP